MIVVSDTSVITSLLHIHRLSLLENLFAIVLIPRAVHVELSRSHANLPAFLQTREVQNQEMVQRLEADLDRGEAEAIVLAKESHADLLLIDEKLGRVVAVREGLLITGLVGVLVEAKRRQMILSVRELLDQLETKAGFRLSEGVKKAAFLESGE